jgi:hypothetical protein
MEHMMSEPRAERVEEDIIVTKGQEQLDLNGRYYDPATGLYNITKK